MRVKLFTGMVLMATVTSLISFAQPWSLEVRDAVSSLAGIWVSEDNPNDILRIAEDGSYRLYTIEQIYGGYDLKAVGVMRAGTESVTVMDTFGTEKCASTDPGAYRIALGADTLRFHLEEDTCSLRISRFGGAFRKAGKHADLIGTWVSEAGDYVAVFGRDLTFEFYAQSDDSTLHDVEAGIFWPESASIRLATDGLGSLNCGGLSFARYGFDVLEDGHLTFAVSHDACPYRRGILDGAQFHRADEVETLVGRWASRGEDPHLIHIHRDATYDLHDLSGNHPQLVVQGRIWLGERGLRFEDIGGEKSCPPTQQATSGIRVLGDELGIQLISDPCASRAAFFGEHRAWDRVADARQ